MKKIFFLLITLFIFGHGSFAQKKRAHNAVIEGYFDSVKKDTVFLQFFKDRYGCAAIGSAIQTQVITDGHFRFTVPEILKPGYFTIYSNSYTARHRQFLHLEYYLIEPGDNVKMDISEQCISFSGAGADKYRCKYGIDSTGMYANKKPKKGVSIEELKRDVNIGLIPLGSDDDMNAQLAELEKYEAKLSALIYQVIKCDIISGVLRGRYDWLAFTWDDVFRYPDSIDRKQKMKSFFDRKVDIQPDVSEEAKIISAQYPDLVSGQVCMATRFEDNILMIKDCAKSYSKAKSFTGRLREKLAVSFLAYLTMASGIRSYDSCVRDAIGFVKDKDYLTTLSELGNRMTAGSESFQFSLPGPDKSLVSLASMKGKVVLLDFWFTGCDACLSCARGLRRLMPHFMGNDSVVFVSISVDKNEKTWLKSLSEDTYASPTLETNLYTNGEGWEHPILDFYKIYGFPFLLLIGKDGKLFSSLPPRPDGYGGVKDLTAMIDEAIRAK